MGYSIQIDNTISALASCMRKIDNGFDHWGWDVSVNGNGFCNEIYFNFNVENEEFTISDCPEYEEMDSLDEILELLSEEDEEDEE